MEFFSAVEEDAVSLCNNLPIDTVEFTRVVKPYMVSAAMLLKSLQKNLKPLAQRGNSDLEGTNLCH